MNPEQLLDDLERWAREVQRCSAGDIAAARRARGKLKFARQQALGFMLQKELEVKALRGALEGIRRTCETAESDSLWPTLVDIGDIAKQALLEPKPESPKP